MVGPVPVVDAPSIAATEERAMPTPRTHLPAPPLPPERGPSAPPRPSAGGPAGPPPPPAPAGSDAEARASAASWVAAAGALLLLAAAGTFLAVSWETLGLPARIAVVAAITGAALLGGHRLRSRLPAVGTVVYHLGALLLPVDALGLVLHLDAEVAVRWLSVGAVAVVAFPPLARAGRSRTLAWAAVAGVPVVATGVGLAGWAPAAIGVAAAGMLLLGAVRPTAPAPSPRSLEGILATAGPALALLAVYAPLVIGLGVSAWDGGGLAFAPEPIGVQGPIAAQLAAAGWLASSWTTGAIAGALSVTTLAFAATRRRSVRLASMTPITALAALLVTVMPPATPRLALLLAPAVAFLAIELAAAATAAAPALWNRPLRTAAWLAELAATLLAPLVVLLVLGVAVPVRGDPEAAFALVVGAVGLLAAIGARRLAGGEAPEVPALLGGTGMTLAAALALVVPRFGDLPGLSPMVRLGWLPVALVLLAAGAATLGDRLRPDAPDRRRGMVAVAVGTTLAVLATTSMLWQPHLVAVAVVAVLLLTGHLRSVVTAGGGWTAELVAAVLPVAIGLAVAGLLGPGAGGALASVAATSVMLLVLLALAVVVAPLAPARGASLAAVAAVGLLAGAGAAGWKLADASPALGQAIVLSLFGGLLASLVPIGLATAGVVAVAVRWRDPRLGVLVAPLVVRVIVVTGLVLADGRLSSGWDLVVLAVVLAVAAVAAVVAALVGPTWLRPVAAGVAVVGLAAAWLLVAHDPVLRAGGNVLLGLTVAGVAAMRGQRVVAHLGGALATIGVWQLLDLRAVEALDLYALPVAAHLWVAGRAARRRHGSSSWVTDVPPLLLVAIPALGERLAGGAGWHAVLAGGLAAAAVAYGGAARLGGPLFVGTVLLVATVVVEVVAMIAAVPTWVWLATGGAALLVVAAAIERTGGSPVSAARRLREVVTERFD
jgi:hypothetical protein